MGSTRQPRSTTSPIDRTSRNARERVATWPGDPCAAVMTEQPDLADALTKLEAFTKDA